MRKRKTKWKVYAVDAAAIFLAVQCTAVLRDSKEAARVKAAQSYPIMIETEAVIEVETEVTVETEAKTEPQEAEPVVKLSSEDESILLKIAMAEAEGESVEGKALVMLVVLNRVQADEFPNTVKSVVFQKNQFSPTSAGGRYWSAEPDAGCYAALAMVENGWDESMGALYFESCIGDCWQSENLFFLFQNGNHKFYR